MTLRQFLDAAYTFLVQQAMQPGMTKDGRMVPGLKLADALEHYEPYRAQTIRHDGPRREPDPLAGMASKNDQAMRRLMGMTRLQGARG